MRIYNSCNVTDRRIIPRTCLISKFYNHTTRTCHDVGWRNLMPYVAPRGNDDDDDDDDRNDHDDDDGDGGGGCAKL